MEFWGVEVKAGEPFKVTPGDDMVLHLSQACLGETKKDKGSETVCLFVTVAGKKLVLGTLFTDKLPQQQFDLVFDRDFEISHNWKSGSVYFYGYKASNPYEDEEIPEGESDDSESEEDIPLTIANNGKPEPKAKKEKPAVIEKAKSVKGKEVASSKQVVKNVPNKEDAESSDDSMSEDDDDSEDSDDSDDSEDESGESDEETPKKAETSKKRAPESSIKTPVQDKKAKVTPQKTDGKKVSGHVATPYPSKQGKTPANKPLQATPKSGGSHSCKNCSKTFGSEGALDSHTKAKHSTTK